MSDKTNVNNEINFSNLNDFGKLNDFDKISKLLCTKLINAERNKKLLLDTPHVIIHDLAAIFYIVISNNNNSIKYLIIKNEFINDWNLTVDQLYKIAMENTQKIFKGTIDSMAFIIDKIIMNNEKIKNHYDLPIDYNGNVDKNKIDMYVATNHLGINGSIVILYNGLLKEFASKIGKDLYILPSSIHEIILVPISVNSPVTVDGLKEIVRSINETEVAPDERLSDNIYRYNKNTDEIDIL